LLLIKRVKETFISRVQKICPNNFILSFSECVALKAHSATRSFIGCLQLVGTAILLVAGTNKSVPPQRDGTQYKPKIMKKNYLSFIVQCLLAASVS
jgi:hypothetical protein